MTSANEVWVWVEYCQGELGRVSLGLLGKARELCRQWGGGEVAALLAGSRSNQMVEGLINHGAGKVYLADVSFLTPFETDLFAGFVS